MQTDTCLLGFIASGRIDNYLGVAARQSGDLDIWRRGHSDLGGKASPNLVHRNLVSLGHILAVQYLPVTLSCAIVSETGGQAQQHI